MTAQEAQEIIEMYHKWWPFTRLTEEQMKQLEQAHKTLRQKEINDLGEPPF